MYAGNFTKCYVLSLTIVEYLKLIATHKPELCSGDAEDILTMIRNDDIDGLEYHVNSYNSILYEGTSLRVGNTIFLAGPVDTNINYNSYRIGYYTKDDVFDDAVIHDMQQAVEGITINKPTLYIV